MIGMKVRTTAIASGLFALVMMAASGGCGARASLDTNEDGSLNAGGGPSSGPSTGNGAGAGSPTSGNGAGAGSPTSGSGVTGSAAQGAGGASGGSQSTSGQTGSGGPSGSSGSGGEICPSLGDQCSECISFSCADAWCECFENPECFDLLECTNACNGDEACEQACLTAHQGGISDVYGISDCAAEQCQGPCDGGEDLEPCAECLVESCEDELNACLGDPDCLALYDCLSGCEPIQLSCQKQCYMDHGAGTPKLEDLFDCAAVECDGTC
jgi:hypothetical protein